MNYIKLINEAWSLREKNKIDKNEFDLYLFLLHTSNKKNWQNPIAIKTAVICAFLGINRNALSSRRSKLSEVSLIEFKEGIKSGIPAEYKILSLEDSEPEISKTEVKISKTDKKMTKAALKFPFSSTEFFEAWNLLLKTKKWKIKLPETLQKRLNQLAQFDERFAIKLIQDATDNNWQGVVFPQTKEAYKKWLVENEHMGYSESDNADENGYSSESWQNTIKG